MRETQIQSLIWEDATCFGLTEPSRRNYRGQELQLLSPQQQLLKPARPGACAFQEENHRDEKPTYRT